MEGPESNSEITLHHVLFATDFSPASDAGFAYAAHLPKPDTAYELVSRADPCSPFANGPR